MNAITDKTAMRMTVVDRDQFSGDVRISFRDPQAPGQIFLHWLSDAEARLLSADLAAITQPARTPDDPGAHLNLNAPMIRALRQVANYGTIWWTRGSNRDTVRALYRRGLIALRSSSTIRTGVPVQLTPRGWQAVTATTPVERLTRWRGDVHERALDEHHGRNHAQGQHREEPRPQPKMSSIGLHQPHEFARPEQRTGGHSDPICAACGLDDTNPLHRQARRNPSPGAVQAQ